MPEIEGIQGISGGGAPNLDQLKELQNSMPQGGGAPQAPEGMPQDIKDKVNLSGEQ